MSERKTIDDRFGITAREIMESRILDLPDRDRLVKEIDWVFIDSTDAMSGMDRLENLVVELRRAQEAIKHA